jgi:RimJ/RimL family protein N-acetyltransferase
MKDINYDNYFWQRDGVRLRAIEIEDSESYYLKRFDTEGRRQIVHGVELPPTKVEADQFVKEHIKLFQDGEEYSFIIENIQGEKIGLAELNSIDEKHGTFSVGIQIHKEYRRKGYGSSVMQILQRYAFLENRLNKLNVCIIEGNHEGAIFLEKFGCLKECVRREMFYSNGKYIAEVYYGLLRNEFLNRMK